MTRSEAPPEAADRPLLACFGRLRDMILSLAAVETLHRRFGRPIDLLVSEACAPSVLERQPGVARVLVATARMGAQWRAQRRLVGALRERGVGPTWLCAGQGGRARRLLARAGIPDELILDARECPREPGEHEVDRLIRFASATPRAWHTAPAAPAASGEPAVAPGQVPHLAVEPEWREDASAWLEMRGLAERPLILVHAGNARERRWSLRRRASASLYWSAASWTDVVDEVADLDLDAEILLVGTPADWSFNDAILHGAHTPRVHNVARELPVHRLLALAECAGGMIASNTGPAHAAAALGCPLVVLLGADDPAVWLPRSPTNAVEAVWARPNASGSPETLRPADLVSAWKRLTRRPFRSMHSSPTRDAYRVS